MLGCWTLLHTNSLPCAIPVVVAREERGKMEWIIILPSLIELIAQLQFASRRSELTVMEQPRFKVGVLTLSVSATVLK